MSKNTNPARHRASVARSTPFTALSKAVSSNAGTVGRRAAVVTAASAAASGMLIGAGAPATAAGPVATDAHHASTVKTANSGSLSVDRASVSTDVKKADSQKDDTYTVKSGDTLGEIAEKHDVQLKALFEFNGLGMLSIIYPGDTIRLSADAPGAPAEKPAATPSPAAVPAQAPVQQAPVQQAPAQQAPVQQAPVQQAPVQQAPAQQAPVQQAPVQQAPVQQAPQQSGTQAVSNNITPVSGGSSAGTSASTSGIAGYAKSMVGTPYVWGGTSTSGWDCSGFVQQAYAQAGIDLPRTNQWAAMTPTSNPQPGDLVKQNGGSHVGIYLGNGKMVSALNPSQGTTVHSVSAMSVDGYYTK